MNVVIHRRNAVGDRDQWMKLCQLTQAAVNVGRISGARTRRTWFPAPDDLYGPPVAVRAGESGNSIVLLSDLLFRVYASSGQALAGRINAGDQVTITASQHELLIAMSEPVSLTSVQEFVEKLPNLRVVSLSIGPSWQRVEATEVGEKSRRFLFFSDYTAAVRPRNEIPPNARGVSVFGTVQLRPSTSRRPLNQMSEL